MKKFMLAAIAASSIVIVGCQTRITAVKNAEVAHPIEKVVQVNGEDRVLVDHYQVTSGGWEATARSPLLTKETLKGLQIEVSTNGTVRLELADYDRDVSSNGVVLVDRTFEGINTLAAKICAAIVTGGGSTAAEGGAAAAAALATQAYNLFVSKGGNASSAQVTAGTDGTVTVTDGTTTVDCKDGNCYAR